MSKAKFKAGQQVSVQQQAGGKLPAGPMHVGVVVGNATPSTHGGNFHKVQSH